MAGPNTQGPTIAHFPPATIQEVCCAARYPRPARFRPRTEFGPMSVEVLAWVMNNSPTKNADRLVLLAIANYAGDDGWAWPGRATIGRVANLSDLTVKLALKRLVDDGHLSRDLNAAPDSRIPADKRPNLYRVLRGPWCEPPQADVDSSYGSITVTTNGLGDRFDTPAGGSNPYPRALESIPPRGDQIHTPALIEDLPADLVRHVFDAWIASTGRSGRTVLDDRRRKLIRRALDAYPLDDVLDAVRGWEHSAWHRGHNESRRPYHALELLLRNAEHIERFRDLARQPRQPDPGRNTTSHIIEDRDAESGPVQL